MDCEITGQLGTIVKIDGDKLHVWVQTGEACSTCSAGSICPASKGRVLVFDKLEDFKFKVGDKVILEIQEKKGVQALFISYILPFFVLITVMIIVRVLTKNDGLAGLAALISLVPYYFIIFLLKRFFEKTFNFKIKQL